MQSSFLFLHADSLIDIFENESRIAFESTGFVTNNTNPLMIFVKLKSVLIEIKARFRSLALRIDFITETMESNLLQVFQHIYRPREIELMLKQKDLRGKQVVMQIADLRLYEFL